MRKIVNVSEEKAEGLESVSKRITKNVSENVHKVDSIISSARSTTSLFNTQAINARIRLRDACERAILSGSSSTISQRIDEILWRKVYYDPLSTAKKIRQGTSWSEIEKGLIWTHLNDGIAFYHHLLMALSSSVNYSSHCKADLLPSYHHVSDYDIIKKKDTGTTRTSFEDIFFRSLTYLGDLTRYMLDIPNQISNNSTYLLSVRYYHQALHYNCEGGLTHSNLATVYSSNNHPMLAALHYLRALTCEKPFEAAETNLKRMLDRSRIWLENNKLEYEKHNNFTNIKDVNFGKECGVFLHTCLALLSCFINNRKFEEVALLSRNALVQVSKLLDNYDNIDPTDISDASNNENSSTPVNIKGLNGCIESPIPSKSYSYQHQHRHQHEKDSNKKNVQEDVSSFVVTPESMVTLCALIILCIKRLRLTGSAHTNASEALLVSLLLSLISHIITRLEQRFSLIDPSYIQKLLPPPRNQTPKPDGEEAAVKENNEVSLCNGDSKGKKISRRRHNKLAKLRRKRNKDLADNEDSDNEGVDEDENSGDSLLERGASSSSDEPVDDDDEFDDTFDASVLCSSEDDDETDEDVKIECEEEWEGITEEEHVQLIEQEGMLAAVNVITQWLLRDDSTMKMCCKQNSNFWDPFAKLLNLLHVDYEKLSDSVNKERVLSKIKEMTKSDKTEDEELKNLFGHLPESMMLHLVMPYLFQSSNQMHTLKPSEVNLLRMYRMNCIMEELCGLEDTPLILKEGKFIVSEEKVKDTVENAKTEGEASGGRFTPSKPQPQYTYNSGENTTDFTKPINSQKPVNLTEENNKQYQLQSNNFSSKVASSMQSLTAQWLQHEVRNLEEKTSRRMKLGGLYLVPDASVLIHHLSAVKQILASPSHMVIIPQVVIDSLDQQKRDSLGARDAIRWLEAKLRYGSRFMRAQRTHEKAHLPLIKYPKRKDKEAWEWFHLAECCYYLGAQMSKTGAKTSTVTLLTAESTTKMANKKSFSLQTLAEAAGAVLQSVDEFVRKWQISTKGHS